jgi:hypothetical protein
LLGWTPVAVAQLWIVGQHWDTSRKTSTQKSHEKNNRSIIDWSFSHNISHRLFEWA